MRLVFSALLLSALMVVTAAPAAESQLTIDTPMMQLIANATTKPVVEKHLPQLAKRLAEDPDLVSMLGSSSPRELSADPHVRGITEEKLKALQADLLAAQKPQD